MNYLTKLSLVAVAVFAMAPAVFGGVKAPDYNPTNYMYRKASSSVFDDSRARKADALSQRIYAADKAAGPLKSSMEAANTYGPASVMGDLDAPNGEIWFYTGELTYDSIPPDYEAGIWFTELILRAYDFTIYDGDMKVIGHIRDKMRYEPDEVRVPYIDLAPLVTQKFYNTDDYYEIVVGITTNPGVGMTRNHSYVYSLNKPGNTDADGNDLPVYHTYSFIGDVLTVSNQLGSERYIITSAGESYGDYEPSASDGEYQGDPAESPFWQSLLAQKMTLNFYTNAVNDTDGPLSIGQEVVPLTQLQGDQMSAPVVLTTVYNGKPYVVVPKYKDTFYNPYSSPWEEDVTMRQNNSLLVDIYTQESATSQLTPFQHTEIPFTFDSTVDRLLASYHSVGSLNYSGDIDFDPEHYRNTSGQAYMIVTKDNYIAGSDDSYISSYYVYKNTGSRYKTIFTDAQGFRGLSNVPGAEPQMCFISYATGYTFHFVDMLSVKERWSTGNAYNMGDDEEPELLLANFDRVAAGDSYNYVFELRVPTVDENENDCIRAIWLNADGTFNHIDEVNMGTNVLYAQLYLHSAVLKPGIYSSTDNMAYMCLIKRGLEGSSMQEELLVADAKCVRYPEGNNLLACTPCEYGVLASVMPMTLNEADPRLWVIYRGDNLLTLESFKMPLDKEQSGIEDVTIESPVTPAVSFDGCTVSAPGKAITVYDLNGRQVAAGNDTINVSTLIPGIYAVKAGESASKIIVK